MKITFIVLIFIFICQLGTSQKKTKRDIPVLFDTVKVAASYKRERLVLKDVYFSDSLRIGFKVILKFKYPLRDTSKMVLIKSIRLLELEIKYLTTGEIDIIHFSNRNNWSIQEKKIWNRYTKTLYYWYSNQPYEKMIDRQTYDNKVVFGGVLYAAP
jgi:hypothetical protein